MAGGDGWDEYQRMLLGRVDELTAAVHDLQRRQGELAVALGQLQVKAGAWGAAAALLAFLLTLAPMLLERATR
ncbi:MAG: hypothetical protein IT208_00970 [Chthonomonadales bacterium]|nr:hypothetical protein [Chthonomonadales bacterium]